MFLVDLLRKCATNSNKNVADRGSAILAVLGVMGAASVIAVTTTSMSLQSVGYTTATRAGVQAEAAAEAGIDYAAAKLSTGVCQPQYASATAPIFSVLISYSTLAISPGATDISWVLGCPAVTSAMRIKVVSIGTASTPGLVGNSSENIRTVEAVFPYTPTPPPSAIIASGGALYAFAQVDPTINNLTITQAGTTRPSIQYLTGSATCTSQSTIMGDVYLGSGGLAITSGCTINGDLRTSGTVSITSGEVTGNVYAAGVQGGTSITLSTSAIIDGNSFSAGSVSIGGKIGGNVVAGPIAGTSTFSNKASVGGSVISAGTVSAPAGVIKGTTTINQSGIVTPAMLTIPPWVDYAYSATDWKASDGTQYGVIILSACTASALSTALITAQNSPTPIIVDTRSCGAVTALGGYNMNLHSDVVIVANGFTLSSNDFESADSSQKRLWLIVPDSVADNKPTCPVGSSATIGHGVIVGSGVGALFYTPCTITNSGDVWRGQMYAASISTSSAFSLAFLPIGLPTVNLSTGQYIPPPGTGTLGDRTSIRDLTNS